MKKMLVIILTLILCLSAVGCGKEEKENLSNNNDSENTTVEVTQEEPIDYLREAREARNNGQYDNADELFKKAYEIKNDERALVYDIEMWLSNGNVRKTKEAVEYAKDNCENPSTRLSEMIELGEQIEEQEVSSDAFAQLLNQNPSDNKKWMIKSIKYTDSEYEEFHLESYEAFKEAFNENYRPGYIDIYYIHGIFNDSEENYNYLLNKYKLYVDYDANGNIIESNYDFIFGEALSPVSQYYSPFSYSQYEYLEDGGILVTSFKDEDGEVSKEDATVFYFTEDGILDRDEVDTGYGGKFRDVYSYNVYLEYSGIGSGQNISVADKTATITSYYSEDGINYEYTGESTTSLNFTEKKLEQFGISSKVADAEFYNYFDDNDNLIMRTFKGPGSDGDIHYENYYFEWVYCTPEQYLEAKENNDFSAYKISNYETYYGIQN